MRMARLYYLLSVAQHRVSTLANREAERELGLTAAQLGALLVLDKSPDLRQSELAKALSCTKPAVTSLAERLEEAVLIERRPCPDDGRAMRLRLTRKGKGVLRGGKAHVAKLQAKLCEGFSEEEIAIVARFLGSAIERFQ
jgi:DNA-binding MarR family transcriptional regulator